MNVYNLGLLSCRDCFGSVKECAMECQTRILGIVNITEDSFSDGGRYLAPSAALAKARALVIDGAHAVDLGPASSHPDASEVTPQEEIQRLTPVVAALHAEGIAVSVDSWRPETQRWALQQNVRWVNDIRGFPDPTLYPALADSDCGLIAMFSVQAAGRADRRATDPAAVLAQIEAFFDERLTALEAAGVARERVVVDPGMGFFLGSNPETSLAVLRAIPSLKARWGLPVLLSVSRKSFLRKLTGSPVEAIGAATLSGELYAARQGVDWLRTHDARALRDALLIQDALR